MVQACVVLALGLGLPMALSWWSHWQSFGHINATAWSLIGFLLVNSLICLWELCLFYKYDFIRSVYQKRLKDGTVKSPTEPLILFKSCGVRQVFSPSFWAYIWIDYTRWDPAYADCFSFGWAIDVGNGHSTLVPSVVMLVSILSPVFSPKATGILGCLLFWQTMYGTILYFLAFVKNGRIKETDGAGLLLVVCSNIIWIVFPALGLKACCTAIMEDSFRVLQ